MPDDQLLQAARNALPGSRINNQTLGAIIDAIAPILTTHEQPPAADLPQWGWLCNGEPVPGGITVEPAPHWQPLYIGERHT